MKEELKIDTVRPRDKWNIKIEFKELITSILKTHHKLGINNNRKFVMNILFKNPSDEEKIVS